MGRSPEVLWSTGVTEEIGKGKTSEGKITCDGFSGKLVKVSCPICSSPPNPGLVYEKSNGVGIWKCAECHIMYASPRFSVDSLLEIYENETFADMTLFEDWSYDKWKKENKNRLYITQKLKVQLLRQFLTEKDRVLDVGCGPGLFCLEGSKQGLNVEGIEPSKTLVEIGRKVLNLSIRHGLLEDFNPAYEYRGIVVWDVLEHVFNPVELIKKCNSLMEKSGFIFVQVPNYDGLSNRIKTFMCRKRLKKSDFKHFGFPWHLYAFNKRSLAALLEAGGFTPLVFESWSHMLKDGADGFVPKIVVWGSKKFCISDYITCVAVKS